MAEREKTNVFIAILSFLIPIVGIVLYFVKKNDTLEVAKNYLYAGFGFNLLLMAAM